MTFAEQLAALQLTLEPERIASLEWLAAELLRWNRARNLTAITAIDEVVEKHLVDSLTLLPETRTARSLLDLGSGAGFPALPLKVVLPQLTVVSVDAVAKKIAFQRHVARHLNLQHFTAEHGRAEHLATDPAYRSRFDLITARALGDLELLVRLAEPFLAPGGRLVAMKGPEAEQELALARIPLETAGWTLSTRWLQLPRSGAGRCLVTVHR